MDTYLFNYECCYTRNFVVKLSCLRYQLNKQSDVKEEKQRHPCCKVV